MSLPLAGKVAIITGSSRSIGASIARKLASDGANVVVNYVSNASAAEAVVAEINAGSGGKAISVRADASRLEDVHGLLDAVIKEWGRLDILVLNAAIMELSNSLLDVDEQLFDRHFVTNVKVPLFTVKAATPLLKQGMGRFVPLYYRALVPFRRRY